MPASVAAIAELVEIVRSGILARRGAVIDEKVATERANNIVQALIGVCEIRLVDEITQPVKTKPRGRK